MILLATPLGFNGCLVQEIAGIRKRMPVVNHRRPEVIELVVKQLNVVSAPQPPTALAGATSAL